MRTCPSKTYDFTPEIAAQVKTMMAKTFGLTIDTTAPSGAGKEPVHGIVFNWTIADGKITIIVVSKPWWMSCDMIYSHLDDTYAELQKSNTEVKGE
jgi:hypothetical protein